ncbi:hypothetical protein ACT1UG_09785 [Bacillus paramycoides]|uniref:hypothetical protein n=1 Tax=Bacillus paramycoides TaxID=2026194 RepID=UPI00405A3917
MKAYQVSDGEYSTIVFMETAGQAKAWGSNEFGIDFVDVQVKRCKWADNYKSMDEIPKREFLEHGWFWECICGIPQYDDDAIIIDETVYCEKCKPIDQAI